MSSTWFSYFMILISYENIPKHKQIFWKITSTVNVAGDLIVLFVRNRNSLIYRWNRFDTYSYYILAVKSAKTLKCYCNMGWWQIKSRYGKISDNYFSSVNVSNWAVLEDPPVVLQLEKCLSILLLNFIEKCWVSFCWASIREKCLSTLLLSFREWKVPEHPPVELHLVRSTWIVSCLASVSEKCMSILLLNFS